VCAKLEGGVREIARAVFVYGEARCFITLGFIYGGVGREMNDDVGANHAHGAANGGGISDIEVVVRQTHDGEFIRSNGDAVGLK